MFEAQGRVLPKRVRHIATPVGNRRNVTGHNVEGGRLSMEHVHVRVEGGTGHNLPVVQHVARN